MRVKNLAHFWLHYKRLEQNTFKWPGIEDEQLSLRITSQQLDWLIAGLPLMQPHAHPTLCYHYHDL
ncbi:IS66 family insertion sequence element accessory protein TnpB [Shewanella profunda]|uniref:IS66 family insertion sequence element accessory protein TnpB n=1 Tax=Shewanella profunda TaxID=254793 RepID=UPI0035D5ED59